MDNIAALTMPEFVEWEVLVVDNNSSDQTRAVIEDFARRLPGRIRHIFESQPGLSHARNAGIREARGDIVAFTDDDVSIPPTWLQSLTRNLNDGEWSGAGGRVLPERSFAPPRWLSTGSQYALGALCVFDLGPEARPLAESPFGANMAFRKEMFEKYGYFRTDLGRKPGSLMSNEDTEFGRRLFAGGERLRYEPTALVFHPVSAERMQKRYFLDWWLAKGRAQIREFGPRAGAKWHCRGIPLYLVRNLATGTLRWMAALSPSVRFENKLAVCFVLGEIAECYQGSCATKAQTKSTAVG
jgi:glycosyltransferase involved in cell wall biosynthesis